MKKNDTPEDRVKKLDKLIEKWEKLVKRQKLTPIFVGIGGIFLRFSIKEIPSSKYLFVNQHVFEG